MAFLYRFVRERETRAESGRPKKSTEIDIPWISIAVASARRDPLADFFIDDRDSVTSLQESYGSALFSLFPSRTPQFAGRTILLSAINHTSTGFHSLLFHRPLFARVSVGTAELFVIPHRHRAPITVSAPVCEENDAQPGYFSWFRHVRSFSRYRHLSQSFFVLGKKVPLCTRWVCFGRKNRKASILKVSGGIPYDGF